MISSSELQQLVSAWIITLDQSQSIAHFQSEQKSSSGWFSHSIMTIWAILIGLGILSLVALNRDGMTDILKIATLLVTMTTSYLLWRYFKNLQKSLLWGTLLFLSGLLCGASIFLIAQIYNLTVTNDILLWIWILMILPLVYVLRQKEFYRLYMILLSCVLWQFLLSHVFQTVDERTTFVLYIFFGFLMMVVGLFHDYIYDDPSLARLYKIFGANISIIAYAIFIMISDNDFADMWTWAFHFQTPLVRILIVLWLSYIWWYLWKKDTQFLRWFIGFLLLLIWVATADLIIINYTIFILLCLLLIYMGYQANNGGIIKTANIYLYLFLLYLYGKYGREYENKALFFIIGGVLMIGLGLGFSKLNKFLQWSIKE